MRKSQLHFTTAYLWLLSFGLSLSGSASASLLLQSTPPAILCHHVARHLDRLSGVSSPEPQVVALLTAPEPGARLAVLPVVLVPEWLPPWPWSPQLLNYVRSRVVQQVRDYLWQPMQQAYYTMWPGGGQQTSRKPSAGNSPAASGSAYEAYQLLFNPWGGGGGNFSLNFGLAFNAAFNIRGNVQVNKKQQPAV